MRGRRLSGHRRGSLGPFIRWLGGRDPNEDAAMGVWREPWDDVAFPQLTVEQLSAITAKHRLDVAVTAVDRLPSLLAAAVDEGAINADNARTLAQWFDRLRPAVISADGYRRFVHGDAQPANVLAKETGEYSALIDWGDAGWGDPAVDFRLVPARAIGRVLAGYREVGPLDGDESAEARIWWDHLWSAVYNLRRDRVVHSLGDWNRPPGARMVELLARLADGGTIGNF
ncbi:MAG: aminoglycoside phosphotransferase family protein [Actinobacteria bacterium]|nr:aminoglycoside phosphotransferase family protein [Actinomycetota bacterium]